MKQKMVTNAILLSIAFLFLVSPVAAAENKNYQTITAPEVKNMQEKGEAVLIHVLSELEFEMQHIAGSINIPVNEIKTTDKLPKDKETRLIFYCMGRK